MKRMNCLLNQIALSCLVLIAGEAAYAQQNDAPKGVWESPNNRGGAVGIDLHEAKLGDARAILEIGVYERAKDGLRCLDQNFFEPRRSDPNDASNASYSEGSLVIHYEDRTSGHHSIDLDLTFDRSNDQWTGRFHRGSFDERVVLKRVLKYPVLLQPCISG